jgi:methylmalonyl-CoA/ethylmalonyl-CoA epimerase
MIEKIDHLGIAVKDLQKARRYYEDVLGLVCEGEEEVPSQKIRTAFYNVGGVHLELLEATSEDSPVAKFLEKRGEGIHHLAFKTDGVQAQLNQAKEKGVRLINDTPTIGAGGKNIAFLHPASTMGVLTEFCSAGEH